MHNQPVKMKFGVYLLLLVCISANEAFSSSGQQVGSLKSRNEGTTKYSNLSATIGPASTSEIASQSTTELNFKGEFHHNSEMAQSVPSTCTNEMIHEFFHNPKHRDLLLKGGDNPIETLLSTKELYDEWKFQSSIVQSEPPDHLNDPILAIYSTVPLLPGLAIEAVSYTGCKLRKHPVTSLPVYEFTLIKEEYIPAGVKPMRWIFNQITGNKSSQDPTEALTANRKTHGLARVSLEQDGKTGRFKLAYFGSVEVSCSIPRRILNVLPMSKGRVEAKVSKSIVKQLERESVKSIEKFQAAFESWLTR